MIDLLNAESANAAIPIAAFDIGKVGGGISVRPSDKTEEHQTFQGETERPMPGEVIFADEANQAHSRRWVFRQGDTSVVRQGTGAVLVVAEALHDGAEADLDALKFRLKDHANLLGLSIPDIAHIGPGHRRFDYAAR